MNTLPSTHDIGLLRRQVKNDVIDHIRSRQGGDDRLTPADVLIRALSCRLKALGRSEVMPEEIAEKAYGGNHIQRAMLNDAMRPTPALLAKAAVSPAMTTTPGWAQELVAIANYAGLLPGLVPASAYSQLAARGLRIPFGQGAGIVNLPSRLPTPLVAGDFISEGAAIPTRRLALTPTSFGPPKKCAVISHYTQELQERSIPTIESVLRETMQIDTAGTIDSKLLDNVAGSAVRPPGLLNGISGLTPVAGGGAAALGGDLGNLANAIPNPLDLTYVMTAADYVRATALMPGLGNLSIITAPVGLASKTVIAIDAADFVSGETDTPRFDLSSDATVHTDDTSPLPIGTPGSPNTIAAPTISMYQQDLIALRCIWHVVWAMRRAGRVAFVASITW